MRELLSWMRRRWLLPVLEAEAASTQEITDQLQACTEALARIEARLGQLELDLAAEGEAMAERLTTARLRHERLAAEVDALRGAGAAH
jgi:hypothetical protein